MKPYQLFPALIAPVLLAAAGASAPADAGVVFALSDVGKTHTATFDGLVDPTTFAPVPNTSALDATLALRLLSTDGVTWRFGYTVDNLAGTGFSNARVTGFGFDLSALPTQATASGTYDRPGSGDVGGGFLTDFCAMAGGNGCATNSASGIRAADPVGTGIVQLRFAQQQTALTLSNLYVRWHHSSLNQMQAPPVSITEITPADPAPEPAAWALMIAGFGLVGAALRRGRRAGAPAPRT